MKNHILGAMLCAIALCVSTAQGVERSATSPQGADEGSDSVASTVREKAETARELAFVGNVHYDWSGNVAHLRADQVHNSRTSGTSGSLRVTLWATTTAPVYGDTITFETLATYNLGQLGAGQSLFNVDSGDVPFTAPTNGTYYITMALQEYSGDQWYYYDLVTFSSTQTWPRPGCSPSNTNLCLSGSRFRVSVNWQVPAQGTSGVGTATSLSSDTGHFWFFQSSNVELVVKVLDGRAINGYFWVFYGALSNVQYAITVTDTQTGAVRVYTNPSGQQASVGDTTAFAGSGGQTPNVNLSGTWDAVLTAGSTQADATFTLNQVGTNVTGTAAIVGGGGGSLTGTVTGQSFTFSTAQVSPCAGTFNGLGSVNAAGTQMSGSYSGTDCTGSFSATFTATKR